MDKNGWKKKRKEHCTKIESVQTTKEEGKRNIQNKDPTY